MNQTSDNLMHQFLSLEEQRKIAQERAVSDEKWKAIFNKLDTPEVHIIAENTWEDCGFKDNNE